MKARRPDLDLSVNGGIDGLDAAEAFLAGGLDGVMIGRAAYHARRSSVQWTEQIFAMPGPDVAAKSAVAAMLPYIEAERSRGTPLNAIARHMLGAFQGLGAQRSCSESASSRRRTPSWCAARWRR